MRLKLLLLTVIVTWLLTPFLAGLIYPDIAQRGQLGDVFGAANALFSGLAFAGLCYSIWSQQQQLSLQQDQLELQREELRLQREEMTASRQELSNQVAAQQALARAATAHIAVAGFQAEIEAMKIQASEIGAGGRQHQTNRIMAISHSMRALSDRLEDWDGTSNSSRGDA